MNGDGLADIIGFSSNGVVESLGTGGGNFGATNLVLHAFTAADGWISNDQYPRLMGDVTGDHADDVLGFSSSGIAFTHSVLL